MKTISLLRRKKLFTICFAVFIFGACQKTTTPFTPPPPPPPTNSCLLIDETKSFAGNFDHYWYTYTKDNKLDSIYYADYPGATLTGYCKEDPDGFLWITYKGTDGKTPNKFDYLYTGGMQDSANLPTSLATSYQLYYDGINTAGYAYTFQYKADGKFDGYYQSAPFVTGLLYGLGVEYDNNGDISTMVYSVITGPKLSSTVTANGFDGHPSPYSGIAGWIFLTPATQWTSPEYEQMFYALSPHNPTGSKINFGTSILTDVMSYEYNSQGYPTKRTVIRTDSSGNSTTITHTYAYKCQ